MIIQARVRILLRYVQKTALSYYLPYPSGTPSPTNSVISRFVSTFKRFCNKEFGKNLWQRSFNDHIIRDKEDYNKIWEYIDTNPLKWELDCFYSSKKEQ